MAEDTHREKAHTAGTLTRTMTKVLTRPFKKTLSLARSAKFFRPMKPPNRPGSCILVLVRLVMMQMNIGMMTNPKKNTRLGSMNT